LPSARYEPLLLTLDKFGQDASFIAGGYYINENVPERYVYLRDCFAFSFMGNDKGFDYFDFPFGNSLLTHFVISDRAYVLSMDKDKKFAEFQWGILWNEKKPFPGEFLGRYVSFSIGSKVDGKGYYGAGEAKEAIEGLRDLWQYNPEEDKWEKFADFPGSGNVRLIANTIADKVYIGLGFGLEASPVRAEQYTRAYDFWEFFPKGYN
jgi:hypothetical protein